MSTLRPRSRVRPTARRRARLHDARVRYEWDILAGTLRWGAGLERLLGHAEGEPWGFDAWCGILHPDEARRVDDAMVDALDSEAPRWSAEYHVRRADGSFVRVRDHARIERDGRGRAVRLAGVLHQVA